MPNVLEKYCLYSVHWEQCVGAALGWLPAGSGVSVLVQEQLPSLIAAVVVELAGPEFPRYLRWGPDFI